MPRTLQKLVVTALFAALVAVATMAINIPMPATQGFVNVGDTMIFVAGIFLGPAVGLLAGGIGSGLADLLLGYVHWAPWTLFIKSIEGLLAGLIAYRSFQKKRRIGPETILAMLIAAIWMVFGYYLAGGIMRGFPAALASVPGNIIQGVGSIILAIPVIHGFRKHNLTDK
ncbi:MAG: ECF transporter S component [bacterium]|jgi:uncharacterized membrane protein